MPYYPPRYQEEVKKRYRKGKTAQWILLGFFFGMIFYGSIGLGIYLADLQSSRETTRQLKAAAEEVPTIAAVILTETAAPEQENSPAPVLVADNTSATLDSSDTLPAIEYPNGYSLVPKIQELRKKSEYIIGWLTMDDLDEPVVRKDNSFFLNHDAMGKKNGNGAIFMDQHTDLLMRPYTILLYGHNMKTGAMFGNLRKYEEFSYCYKHRFLQFDTLYEEGKYEIFAVSTVSLTPGKAKYVDLTGLQSADRRTRREVLGSIKLTSVYRGVSEANEEDQMLLLITCVGEDDERLIVAARRLGDGE